MILFWKKNLAKITIAILSFGMVVLVFVSFPKAETLTTSDLGVVSFVSSLPPNRDKLAIVKKTVKAGFGWLREEYTYSNPMNYVPYDVAYEYIRGADLNILGLLTYPGPNESHDVWKNYVTGVVERYPMVGAWEIMNEVDNHLPGTDYVPYLKEAYNIIKARSDAPVICSGLTHRVGVEKFWDDMNAAGGWSFCDGIGLHIYHQGSPSEDLYNGTLAQEIQQVVDNINKNGGGPSTTLGINKKIWITEYGYDSNKYGIDKQAEWLVEGLKIIQGFPEVERIFVFRLYEHEDGLGLLAVDFSEKDVFEAVQDWLAAGAPAIASSVSLAQTNQVAASSKALIDKTKSLLRLDGENIVADGKEQYRIVIGLKDAEGKIVTNQKPNIILSGGETFLTDFVLVGEEWFAYVAAAESGERTAQIKAGEVDLGTLKMVFSAKVSEPVAQPVTPPVTHTTPVVTTQPVVKTQPVVSMQTAKRPSYALFIFISLETLITFLILIVIFKLVQRHRLESSLNPVFDSEVAQTRGE